jgi:threonine/homoserine/homoserine lactone efflux protein
VTGALVGFVLASAALVLLPGPDSMLMLRAIALDGRAAGIRTGLGILSGLVVWIVSAVAGLAALLKASDVGYTTLRLVGAAYLLLLGVQALRSRGVPDPDERRRLFGTGYAAGLATNLFNPKVGVFFVTFLPGFVPEGASLAWTSLLFGGIFVVETLLYFGALLVLVEPVARAMRTEAVRNRINRVSGGVLIAFGLRLATEG